MGKVYHTGLQSGRNRKNLYQKLQKDETLYLVTDGGETNGKGYFGWVIGNKEETIVKHKEHSAGNSALIESLRTEIRGPLSLLYFVTHFCKYHKITNITNLCTHLCDNMTAVRRTDYNQERTIPNHTTTLNTDYGIHTQI